MKSPLLLGTFLSNISDATYATISNKAAISINQDPLGEQGVLRKSGGWVPNSNKPTNPAFGFQIWSGALSKGRVAVVLANLDNSSQQLTLTNSEMPPGLGAPDAKWDIVEAFSGKTIEGVALPQSASVGLHDVAVWTMAPAAGEAGF